MKMTREEAITECRKHWEFLKETGTDDRRDYKATEGIASKCFFCALVTDNPCKDNCPGWEYWATAKDDCQGHCMDDKNTGDTQTSLFNLWLDAESKEERQLWASRIVWMVWLIQEDDKSAKKNT